MCMLSLLLQLVVKAIAAGDQTVLADARRIAQYGDTVDISSAEELANRLFHTVFMGTANSSKETRSRYK